MPVLKTYKNGTWESLGGFSGSSGSSIDMTAEVGQTIVVEEVDADGKPTKWKSADYQPRTHWSEVTVGDIVPPTTFTPVLYEAFGCTVYPVTPFKLEEKKSYTVIFDGVEYDCIPLTFEQGNMTMIGLGNPVFAGGENNGMPFAVSIIDTVMTATSGGITTILSERSYYMVLCMDTEQHTLQVIGEKTVYNKIPEEYVKSDLVVEFTTNPADRSLVMVTPWEEITEAVKANKNIYGLFPCEEDFEFNDYGNAMLFYNTDRLICVKAKIGRNTQECELRFMGVFDKQIFLDCTRDKNGITTITSSTII